MKSVKYWTPRQKVKGSGAPPEEVENRRKVRDFLAKDWVTDFPKSDIWDRTHLDYYDLSTYKKQ